LIIKTTLNENTQLRLEEELRDLAQHLAKMLDMLRRAEEACQELVHALNYLNICLKKQQILKAIHITIHHAYHYFLSL